MSPGISFLLKLAPIVLTACNAIANEAPTITIPQGSLVGKYRQSTNGRTFSSFTGIPYAKPPIGDLRFKAPVPAEPWKGILNATQPHSICPQINAILNDYVVKGNEDCLYLNVYTPKVGAKKLPVLYFIHCGGWMWGNANSEMHGPEHFMDKSIILVTANYRLGALGFLSTGDDVIPGNNGLKDQSLALRWIYENIEYFGGDPNQITIFGQSAGAASVHFHMLSPLSKDFIKGAISNSGSAFGAYAVSRNFENQRNTRKLAQFFNCPVDPSTQMVQCLQKIDAYSIVDREKAFYKWLYFPVIPFKPVIEPIAKEAFITEDPVEIVKSGKAANVPFIIGLTSEEGVLVSGGAFREAATTEEFYSKFDDLMPVLFHLDETSSNIKEVKRKIKQFYFHNTLPNRSTLTKIVSDTWFGIPAKETVDLHTQYNNASVFYYLFQYKGTKSFSELFGTTDDCGVAHCDDLFYLFTTDWLAGYQQNQEEKEMTNIMTNLWTNFVITGNPTPPATEAQIPTIWDPITTDNLQYFSIKGPTDLKMEKNMYTERYNFLETLSLGTEQHVHTRDDL